MLSCCSASLLFWSIQARFIFCVIRTAAGSTLFVTTNTMLTLSAPHQVTKHAQLSLLTWLSAGAIGNEAQKVKAELDKMEEDRAAHSDEFPIFQLIPKEMMISKGRHMKLLPNDMGQWHTKVQLFACMVEPALPYMTVCDCIHHRILAKLNCTTICRAQMSLIHDALGCCLTNCCMHGFRRCARASPIHGVAKVCHRLPSTMPLR